MAEGVEEVAVDDESGDHCRAKYNEEEEVDDEDSQSNLPQAWERIGLGGQKHCQPTAAHREGVPGPGEMPQPLPEVHIHGLLLRVLIEHADTRMGRHRRNLFAFKHGVGRKHGVVRAGGRAGTYGWSRTGTRAWYRAW